MVKQTIKIYLEPDDIGRLKQKAGTGRGAISLYIKKICNEPVVFLDENVKALIKTLDLK